MLNHQLLIYSIWTASGSPTFVMPSAELWGLKVLPRTRCCPQLSHLRDSLGILLSIQGRMDFSVKVRIVEWPSFLFPPPVSSTLGQCWAIESSRDHLFRSLFSLFTALSSGQEPFSLKTVVASSIQHLSSVQASPFLSSSGLMRSALYELSTLVFQRLYTFMYLHLHTCVCSRAGFYALASLRTLEVATTSSSYRGENSCCSLRDVSYSSRWI